MEKKRKKSRTVDDLYKMTGEQFAHTHAETAKLGERMDARFDGVIEHMNTTKREIINAVNAIRDEKVEQLEKDMAKVKQKLGIA